MPRRTSLSSSSPVQRGQLARELLEPLLAGDAEDAIDPDNAYLAVHEKRIEGFSGHFIVEDRLGYVRTASVVPWDGVLMNVGVGRVDTVGYLSDILRAMVKVLISLPDELLARLDAEATARGVSRSRLLQDAAQHELGWPSPATIEAALARGRLALESAGTFESADLAARDRMIRDGRDRRRR
mgnify:CR=1 FL=1